MFVSMVSVQSLHLILQITFKGKTSCLLTMFCTQFIFRVLTWEDGYFDHSKARRNIENCLDELYFNRSGELFSFAYENGIQNESASPLGVVETDMSCLHYSLGEG